MIYKRGFFAKEFRQSCIEIKMSYRKMISFGIFLGLLSFTIHFMLQTVSESVLTQKIPEIMTPSYFSVLFVYVFISFVFFIVYFLVYYKYLTFNEISHNKWYALVKMGYKPLNMIFKKILAVLFSTTVIYTVGFAVSLFLTGFLKYFFVYQYFPSLYIAGFIEIVLIVFITMSASIFIKHEGNARYFTLAAAVLLFTSKLHFGYYDIVSNRILMQSISNMFDFSKSLYLPIMSVIFVVCIITCFIGAKYTSQYYWSVKNTQPDIVIRNFRTNIIEQKKSINKPIIYRLLDYSINLILITFILISLAFNAIVLTVSLTSSGREISLGGTIPYVFQSSTMQPTIEKNDLAYFKKIDFQYPLKKGDVVLFNSQGQIYVERITETGDPEITVDIDYYPPMTQTGAMVKFIPREDIYGLYFDRNRWLGALILFANTIFGRILFLLIPSILIFFYKPIKNKVKKLT